MGALSGIAKIASVAGPVLSVVYPPAGLAISAVGAVAGSVEAKKAGKAANDAARGAIAAQQAEIEKSAERAAQLYQDDIARSLESQKIIKQNKEQVQQALAEAKRTGDQMAIASLQRQLDRLDTRLAEENRIAQQTYQEGATKLQEMEMKAVDLYGQDLKVASRLRTQFQEQNAKALGLEVANRAYEDKVQKQVTEQALQEAGLEGGAPRGLMAAQSEQDARFEQLKREAERAAVARGEDPRRAALSVEMEQARAGGQLSADYRKNRIKELQDIAAGNRLSSGTAAANIAAQGLQLGTPTEGREMADLQTKFGTTALKMQQQAGAGRLQRYTAGATQGARLQEGYDQAAQERAMGLISGMSGAETAAANAEMTRLQGLGTAQGQYYRSLDAASGKVAGMYGDAAKQQQAAAAEARAAGERSIQSLTSDGVQFAGSRINRPVVGAKDETYGDRIGSRVVDWLKPKSAKPIPSDYAQIMPRAIV